MDRCQCGISQDSQRKRNRHHASTLKLKRQEPCLFTAAGPGPQSQSDAPHCGCLGDSESDIVNLKTCCVGSEAAEAARQPLSLPGRRPAPARRARGQAARDARAGRQPRTVPVTPGCHARRRSDCRAGPRWSDHRVSRVLRLPRYRRRGIAAA